MSEAANLFEIEYIGTVPYVKNSDGALIPARAIHRALWGWLSRGENAAGSRGPGLKVDWPAWARNGGKINGRRPFCVACEVGQQWLDCQAHGVKDKTACAFCPVAKKAGPCMTTGSVYNVWSRAPGGVSVMYAAQMRDAWED